MNERKPTWNCPVCDSKALYDNLLIDGYFQEVLESKDLPKDENDIILERDGSWKPVPKDEERTKPPSSLPPSSSNADSSSNENNGKKADDEVECIDLSDDDDAPPPLPSGPGPNAAQLPLPPLPAFPPNMMGQPPPPMMPPQEIECIDLD